ncbi:MAG: GbsR/MarR family transcriptional regulator [Pseudomonadota bacterium]
MNVTPYQQDFILHFGEMGSRWGISRTVGQIYALLYVTEAPINADDIVSALGLSRSNVSMGLKELQSWRLVKPQHLPGDRREYFKAPDDLWQIFRTLIEERRKREVDPTLSMLRNALMNNRTGTADAYAEQRLREMQELIELSTQWLDDMQQLEQRTAVKLMKLGGGVSKLLAGKSARRS